MCNTGLSYLAGYPMQTRCNEGFYPPFVCARQGRLIAEIERDTSFQLPVTYRRMDF